MSNRNRKICAQTCSQKYSAHTLFRRTVIASSISLALVTTPRAFAEWGHQAEVFLRPGTERSYMGVDAVFPLHQSGEFLFATDLKAHLGEDGTHELNLGLYWRQLVADRRWALGLYGAIDRRRSPLGNNFSQVTTGAEARSDDWDLRLNYYHPTTDRQLVGLGDIGFQGFGVYRNGIYEEAMKGFDVEVGRLLPFTGEIESRLYVTGYRFEGKDVAPTTDGWRLRLEMRPWQNISISLSSQDDDLFGSQHSIEIRYIFGKQSKPGVRLLNERMTDPWHRDIDVVVSPAVESKNPALASVIPGDKVLHVDSSKSAGGDGSFEQPYDSVTACTADKCVDPTYNMVHLWKGGSSTLSPYDPITLQAGQTLWGEGFNIFTGTVTANLPVIGNGANAVTLADNTTVAGIYAWGSISGINVGGNLSIRHNTIQSSGGGIGIYNSGSGYVANITIANNTIDAAGHSNVRIRNSAYGGALEQTVSLTGNTITGSSTGVDLTSTADDYAATATQTVTLSGNTISSDATAVQIVNKTADGDAQQTVTLTDNSLTGNNYGSGLSAINDASYRGTATQTVSLTGNTVTGSYYGINLRNTANNYSNYATQTVILSGNTISSDGTAVQSNNSSSYGTARQTVTLTGNTITGSRAGVDLINNAGGSYFYSYYSGTATQTVTLSGNTIISDGSAVQSNNSAYSNGTAQQTVSLTGNTLNGSISGSISRKSKRGGAVVQSNNYSSYSGTALQTVTLTGNTVTGSLNGIGLTNNANYYGTSATQTVILSGNTVNVTGDYYGYGGNGLTARNNAGYGTSATQNIVTLSGETITTTGAYGVGMRLNNDAYSGTATQTVTLQNTTVNATSGTGIYMYSNYYRKGNDTQTATLLNTSLNAPTPVYISGSGTCTGGGVRSCP